MSELPRRDSEDYSIGDVCFVLAAFGSLVTMVCLLYGLLVALLVGGFFAGFFIAFWPDLKKMPDVLRKWRGLIDIDRLSPDILDPIRPLLPANTRYIKLGEVTPDLRARDAADGRARAPCPARVRQHRGADGARAGAGACRLCRLTDRRAARVARALSRIQDDCAGFGRACPYTGASSTLALIVDRSGLQNNTLTQEDRMARNDDLVPRQGEVMPPEGAPEHGDFNWVNTGILDRYRGRRLTKTVEQLTGGLEVATKFQHAAINYEHARQELLYVRELAKLLPSRLEKARSRLDLEIAEIESDLYTLARSYQLANADHELQLLRKKEEQIQVKIKIQRAKLEKEQARAARYGQTQARSAPASDIPEFAPAAFAYGREAIRDFSVGRRSKFTLFTGGPKLNAGI